MNNIIFIGWVTLILYILQETDAIPQWGKILHLKFTKYSEYEKQLDNAFGLNLKYTHFLLSRYPNFLVNLFTCAECLCVWLNILGFILFGTLLGGIWMFGITTLGSIIGIAFFKYVLKKFYE